MSEIPAHLYVLGHSVAAKDLSDIILPYSSEYVYLERESAVLFLWQNDFEVKDASAYRFGRAFGLKCEVRWTWNGAGFDVQILAEGDVMPQTDVIRVIDFEAEPAVISLWGTHLHRLESLSANTWLETRIPRALHYPVDTNPTPPDHVCVAGLNYCDRMTGAVRLTRWKAVKGYKGEKA